MSIRNLSASILVFVVLVCGILVITRTGRPKTAPNGTPARPLVNAVPAGAKHIQSTECLPPDDASEDPSANNFFSASSRSRGGCHARSQFKDTQARGGFGESANDPQRVQPNYPAGGLALLAQPGVTVPTASGPLMRVCLVNTTQDILAFEAIDSCLQIVQEAQDGDGTWKPIEDLPSSNCGNSYHSVFLAPMHFWAFAAPRYQGTIPMKLRFAMTLKDGSRFLSNTFDGSVNPVQFSVTSVTK